jgi:benzaldehyde dehydrogenase (NAD)
MALLEESTWRGMVYPGGWKTAAGGDAPVTEPATGAERPGLQAAGPWGRRRTEGDTPRQACAPR